MKKNKKTSLLIGSILVILIITSPYLLFINKIIPPDITQLDTIFGVIKAGYYGSVQVYIYWFFSKFVPLFLLILLFIANKDWWGVALLVPISVYLFQLISIVNDSVEYVDEIEFIYTVPILVLVVVPLYFIRSKIAIYIEAVDLKKEMDAKMEDPTKID
tara:strand:- start:39806 stop:40282 length:477 start_codon:yes stop_codon:yes gene_type:complete